MKEFQSWFEPKLLPDMEERLRLLQEVGAELQRRFGGEVMQLIKECGRSAKRLVALMAECFPGFRDQAIYEGRQVLFH